MSAERRVKVDRSNAIWPQSSHSSPADQATRMAFDGQGDGGYNAPSCFPSSFTAINSPPSAQPLRPNSSIPVSSAPRPRRHNPAIADYLGLGCETETPRFDRSSPPPNAPPSAQPPKRKRQRVSKDASNDAPKTKKKAPKRAAKQARQRLISDELRATKRTQLSTPANTQKSSFTASEVQFTHRSREARQNHSAAASHFDFDSSVTVEGTQNATVLTQQRSSARADSVDTLEGDSVYRTEQNYSFNDTRATHHRLQPQLAHTYGTVQQAPTFQDDHHEEDLPDEGIDDDDLLTLSANIDNFTEPDACNRPIKKASAISSSRPAKSARSELPSQFTPPVTVHTQLATQRLDIKPIVRPPFPTPVRDRSPVVGLTPDCFLRTCFRVGEALNVGRKATRDGKNMIIELYARVFSSRRDETKQHFVLCDLFHSKPPYLKAEYNATIWRSVPLHDIDSQALLEESKVGGENKICRCILSTKSNSNKEWVATMLNIWPAKKEDILWVEGIVNA